LQYPASIDSLWRVFAELCGSFIAARLLSEYVVIFLGQNTIRDLRLRLCREILDVPLARFQEMGPGKVLVNLTEDVAVISEAITRIPSICVNFAVVLGGVFYLGWLSMDILWVATRTTQTARPSSGIWKIVLFMCLMSGRRIKIRYSKNFLYRNSSFS
jgi:putative ATP-binding cassette transporter